MLRRYAFGFRLLLVLADAGLAVAVLAAVSAFRFGGDWLDHWRPVLDQPGLFAIAYAATWTAVLWLHGLYRPRARWTLRSEGLAIARATVVMALITLSVLFVFRLPDVSRALLGLLFPAQWAATIATRAILRGIFEVLRARGLNERYVLVVGAGPRAQEFARKLESHRELGLRVRGFVDDDAYELVGRWPYLGPLTAIERLLHTQVIDEVAICLPFSQWDRMNAIAQACEEEGKIVRVPVDVLDHAIAAGRIEDLDGTPVYSLVSGPDRLLALVVKRVADISISAIALLIAAPILAAIAIMIAVRDGRPVLFRQERVGLHGRRFQLLKFRTMVVNADAMLMELIPRSEVRGAAFKLSEDPRITASGHFLRRTSLDELAQLWNVLKGEMSLVGPRPALPREVEGYDLWHRRRLSMKPGITGLWQVSARRSPDFDQWAKLDLSYIDQWSLWLDLKILVRTLPAALEGR